MKNIGDDQLPPRPAKSLLQQKTALLSLAPDDALKAILAAKEPGALVQSVSDQDLYFLVNDIGPEDALPVLALASKRQWEYVLDHETWQRDRIDQAATARWLDLLFRANPRRAVRWLMDEKSDLLELFLYNNIEVKIREHDQDPSDFGDDYTTLDNVFFVRIAGPLTAPESEFGEVEREKLRSFLSKLMENVADLDYIFYQKILLESVSVLPAESEEEIYRLRNVRLAEKGFLPFEEAVGVYQPLELHQLTSRDARNLARNTVETAEALSHSPSILLTGGSAFADGLARIDSETDLLRLQSEFAGLCNRVAAADVTKVTSKETLRAIVDKASGYLSIGLRSLCQDTHDKGRYPTLLQRHLLSDIFRIGFSRALNLKWRAQSWMDHAWFALQGLSLTFWDEERLGMLGGLLLKKPKLFDNAQPGRMYREFDTLEDIQKSQTMLNEIIAIDDLLSVMDIRVGPLVSGRFLNFKNLLLTLWVIDRFGSGSDIRLLKPGEFRDFFVELWTPDKKPSRIKTEMKSSFLSWLCVRSGLSDVDITAKLGHVLQGLFSEIEAEYGRVEPSQLDPRYIHLFLLER